MNFMNVSWCTLNEHMSSDVLVFNGIGRLIHVSIVVKLIQWFFSLTMCPVEGPRNSR